MKILYATSEAVPFCKTGGLADVAGSLPPALAAEGNEVAVILPLYKRVKEKFGDELKFECYNYINLAWRSCYCGLFSYEKDGVTWYFIDNEQYFDRADLYGYDDDNERFGFFSRAIVRMLPHLKFWPDVINCNDWQTALVPIYLKDDGVREEIYRDVKTTLTIHNIEYQGRYGRDTLGYLFGLDQGWANDGTIIMDNDVNLLKGAILCTDAINAVSPTYANELKLAYFAHRLEDIMQQNSYKLHGVLNGIDMKRYDPANDEGIAAKYSVADMSGKAVDKASLQKMMGLREDPNVPIIGIVSRLVSHKGLDLICEVLHDIMELPVQLVVLGKGDKKFEEFFDWAARQYTGRMAVRLDYNESLSMAIYSGCDLFLMPSKSEPCGLSQMIAMRYGTVPIVRETGGLKDSVQPYEDWRDAGTGFTFTNYSSSDMLYVIREAVNLYMEYPEAFARLRQRAMECDFTWNRSANEYLRIYAGVCGKVWPPVEEEAAPFEEAAPAEEKPVKKTRKAAAKKDDAEKKAPAKKRATKKAAEAPAAEVTEAPAEEKKPAKKRATKKAAEAPAAEVTEAAAEEKKPAKKRATKKAAEAPAVEVTEAPAEEKKPAKKRAAKKAAEAPAAEVTEAPAEEKKPAKKAAAKKTTEKSSAKKAVEEEK